jgi:hypothetical protein
MCIFAERSWRAKRGTPGDGYMLLREKIFFYFIFSREKGATRRRLHGWLGRTAAGTKSTECATAGETRCRAGL